MKRVIHLCPFDRNVGDNALNKAIDDMLSPAFRIDHMELVGNPFDRSVFERMNQADGIIFGGGGVIHSCSGGSSRLNRTETGTMWNMPLRWIEELAPKIVLYSVGFNRFSGEPAPLEQMGQFYDVLAEKKALVSFRNDLSRDRFLSFFPRFDAVRETPDPGLFCRGVQRENFGSYALVQIACDRLTYRYPNGIEDFVHLLNALIEKSPVPVYLIPHTVADGRVYKKLKSSLNVAGVLGDMTAFSETDQAMDLYRNALFTISTRGHSQICSIGNFTPTFALSTHPKAHGFMKDIGQEDACFDYLSGQHSDCLFAFDSFLGSLESRRAAIEAKNKDFDQQIDEFNRDIENYFYEGWEPAPFMVAPDAVPEQQFARLEDEQQATNEEAEQGEALPTDHTIAWLPGRKRKVRGGSYIGAKPVPSAPQLPALPIDLQASKKKGFLGWSGAKDRASRSQRSKDGATCGVVISCDENYYAGVPTCLAALRRYNPNLPVTFLDAGLNAEQAAHVKTIVDGYQRIDALDKLSLQTFPSHLSKAALSSLYVNLAPYDKVLYLDVDALVLGSLQPIFDQLDEEADIVGVRGNYFGFLSNGILHTVASEIAPGGLERLQELFPAMRNSGPAINSGCFAVRRELADRWQHLAAELFAFMGYFKTADQALLNCMIRILGLNLRLVDPVYNCMGFQLGSKVHNVQSLSTGLRMDAENCELTLAGRKLTVAHFAGRHKPWTTSKPVAASLAWDWHAAESKQERQEIVGISRLIRAKDLDSYRAEARRCASQCPDAFLFYERIGKLAYSMNEFERADFAFAEAQKLRPGSFVAERYRTILGPAAGRLHTAVDNYRSKGKLSKSTDARLTAFRAEMVPADRGRRARKTEQTEADVHRQIRELLRVQSYPKAIQSIQELSAKRLQLPEVVQMQAMAETNDPVFAAAAAQHSISSDQKRRSENARYKQAASRLNICGLLSDGLTGIDGPIGYLGEPDWVFLDGLSHKLGRKVDQAQLLPEGGDGTGPSQKENAVSNALLLCANVFDRLGAEALPHISAIAKLVKPGGYLLLIDKINEAGGLTVNEGFGLLPPCNKLAKTSELDELSTVEVTKSWFIAGERIVLLKVTKHPTDAAWSTTKQALLAIDEKLRQAKSTPLENVSAWLDRWIQRTRPDARHMMGGISLASPKRETLFPRLSERTDSAAEETTDAYFAHVGYWRSINAGDKLLLEQTGRVFHAADFKSLKARRINIHTRFFAPNQECKFILLGGGGLIHRPNDGAKSFDWAIDDDVLQDLNCPIVGFGLGLNVFRGDEDVLSEPSFRDGLRKLLDKSAFMGVRERQSCEIIRGMFPEYGDRIHYQPCPSLLLGRHYPSLQLPRAHLSETPHVAFNAAFDRSSKRFGDRFEEALRNLDSVAEKVLAMGATLSVVSHCPEDTYLHSILSQKDRIGLVTLHGKGTEEILEAYSQFNLVVGMRSHSQLIPFGMGIPIFSIVTHNKLRWTLEDLRLPSWGAELFDTEFVPKTVGMVQKVLDDQENARLVVKSRLGEAMNITDRNLSILNGLFGGEQ